VGALLIEQWLAGLETIDVEDEASVALVRAAVRRHGAAQGLAHEAIESLATAASELGMNQLRHARDGEIAVRPVQRGGVPGVEVVAADRGPGIADPGAALLGERGATGGGGLGVGFSAAYRLVDELDADIRWGEGTCIRARRFATPLARSEVAVLGRPHPDSSESGDHAAVVRGDDDLLIAVVDGLGHGRPARAAADVAVATVLAAVPAGLPLDALLAACDRELVPTRGAVMAAARLRPRARTLEHAAAGNVMSRVVKADGTTFILRTAARILGGGRRPGRLAAETVPLAAGDTLLMYSDGLRSNLELGDGRQAHRRPVLALADELFRSHVRGTDDALLLVAR
jgi:anti-sigma regulatory factor (Ser/Thr protein kinase)